MERMSKEELNKRKRQKNYYLLVEKTTLYDHRNLKKNGDYKCSNHMLSYQQPSYTHFFQIALLLKTAIFFKKYPAFFKKSLLKKTHTIFFCFLLTQLHLGNFTCKKWKTAQKNLPNIFLLKTHIQNIQNCFSFFSKMMMAKIMKSCCW